MPKRKCSSIVPSFGQNLIIYRKKSGLTQQEVADKLNLNRSTYTKYETSVSEPSLEILLKIADIFDVEPSKLLNTDAPKIDAPKVARPDIIPSESEKKTIGDLRLLNASQKEEILNTISKFIKENNKK